MSAPAAPGVWDTSGRIPPPPKKRAPARSSGWDCHRDATSRSAVAAVRDQSCVIRLYGLRLAGTPPSSAIYFGATNGVCLMLLFSFFALPASAQNRPGVTADSEVRKTLSDFIQAFDNLDWEKFRTAFADDATVFYPRGVPSRADGRAEFEQTFRRVFEQIRAGRDWPLHGFETQGSQDSTGQ